MKPIALLVNDPHLNKDNISLVVDIFDQALNVCSERGITRVILGGDMVTNRSGQPLSVLKALELIFTKFSEKSITLWGIPGNHDKTNPDDYDSYLDLFKNFENVRIFDKPSIQVFKGVNFWFMPYFSEEKWIEEFKKLEHSNKNKKDILITHIAFDGVKNNDGSEVISSLKPSDFKEFSKVFIGHYHNASKIGENLYFTGSAYQNNFGESIIDKGFTVIYDDCSHKLIKSKFPKYIKKVVDVNDRETIRNLVEEYEDSDDKIRFVLRGKKVDCEKISISEFNKRGIDIKFEVQETIEAIELSESESVMSFDKKDIIKDFMNFCKENSINGKKMSYGFNLIKNI